MMVIVFIQMTKTGISIKSYKALLFQSGYFTIARPSDYDSLFLNYPNDEVRQDRSFGWHLILDRGKKYHRLGGRSYSLILYKL